MITHRKYAWLKSLSNTLTDSDRKDMEEFEQSKRIKQTPEVMEYFRRMRQDVSKGNYRVDYNKLFDAFRLKFKELEGVEFDGSEGREENVSCILMYFSKHPDFFKSSRLAKKENGDFISQPSFEKGFVIIGDYGCGKTSTMKVLKELFNNTPLSFKSYTTNRIVTTFESYSKSSERTAYMNRIKTRDVYLDDVKTEKDASNYGIHNLIKDVLEERSNRSNEEKTYMTCNYLENDSDKSISKALYEFNSRYGARVFDRIFSYNIIEFKGGSMRK